MAQWQAGMPIHFGFGAAVSVASQWHATLFAQDEYAHTATVILAKDAGKGNTFTLRLKTTLPQEKLPPFTMVCGDTCLGAKFEITRKFKAGFGASLRLPRWQPAALVTLYFTYRILENRRRRRSKRRGTPKTCWRRRVR